ncbi:GNAT family N-acetyltransferase [Streptosporangiaceae bacterium NEAU-GS5]|nr:GNAT family N-acetyltransferase [Streptosporangiaceae bacterium NEAU-GS5]
MKIRRVGAGDWVVWRGLRLAALADAPEAFLTTLETAQAFTDDDWRAALGPKRGLKAVAFVDDRAVGMVGAYVDDARPGAAQLISMWVHPDARSTGVADGLVEEALAWAREQGFGVVELDVEQGNGRASRFYERLGFTFTGESEVIERLSEASSMVCSRMARHLA